VSIAVRDAMLKLRMAEGWAQTLEYLEESLAKSREDMIGKDFEKAWRISTALRSPRVSKRKRRMWLRPRHPEPSLGSAGEMVFMFRPGGPAVAQQNIGTLGTPENARRPAGVNSALHASEPSRLDRPPVSTTHSTLDCRSMNRSAYGLELFLLGGPVKSRG
jgi:hypothetical protein